MKPRALSRVVVQIQRTGENNIHVCSSTFSFIVFWKMLAVILLCCFVTLLLSYAMATTRKPHQYPPGPKWTPWFGSLYEMRRVSRGCGLHIGLQTLADRYRTKVLGLKLMHDYTVVVFGYDAVKTVLIQSEFIGRPDNFFFRLRCFGKKRGITSVDGPLWHANRTFLVHQLRDLGFGRQTMELMIKDEVCDVISIINAHADKGGDVAVMRLNDILACSVLNVLWALLAGARFARSDPRLRQFLDIMYQRSRVFDMTGGTLNQYPWLRFVAPELSGYNLLCQVNEQLRDFLMAPIEEHLEQWEDGREDDVIFAYINQMKKGNEVSYSVEELLMICMDVFIAGSVTTSSTLDYAFFIMAYYPDIQRKVHHELDSKMQRGVPLNYKDRLLVPYVEAVLMEVQRYFSIVPIIGPRRVLSDTVIDGHHVPKDTTVLISTYSVHRDKQFWCDPDEFRPDRFLDTDGKVVYKDYLIPYGLGKRRCLAEVLARSCLFMFFAGILKEFDISIPKENLPTSDTPLPGLTLSSPKYEAIFSRRF